MISSARRGTARAVLLGLILVSATLDVHAQQPSWQEIGPNDVGGRVTALAVDPANPQHLVAGTPAGGVWQSDDGGTTWTAMTLWLARVPISAIAIGSDSGGHLVAGSGTLSDAGAVSGGLGILETVDGANWSLDSTTGGSPFTSAVLFWPSDPQRVLVATDLGIRLSVDGGGQFTSVLDGQAVSSFAVDPLHANVVFASSRTGLLESTDRGDTWQMVSSWPLLGTDSFGAGVTSLALSAQTPGLLYAVVQVLGTLNQTDRALLLRSTDGGQTFTPLPVPAGVCDTPESCGFAQAIAIDPSNDRRLLLGGDELLVSTDGAATWSVVSGDVSGVHRIAFAGQSVVVAGRSGIATLDAGWTTATAHDDGLAITQVTGLDTSTANPPDLLVATADSGTLLRRGQTGDWHVIFGARQPAGSARFDPFTPSRLFVSNRGGSLFRSDDDGTQFTAIDSGLDMTQAAADMAPIEPSPLEAGVYYTGRMQMFRSITFGDSWTPFEPPGSPAIGTIAASTVVPGRVYFAPAAGGALYKAEASTTTVDQLTINPDPNLRINSIFLDPDAQNVLYAALTDTQTQRGRVFKSADFGADWTEITPPDLAPANTIIKDRFGALYVGTADGVFRSANDGFSWTPFATGLFAGGVTSLKIAGGTIYAGTSGRGVFQTREQTLVSIESVPAGVQVMVDGVLVSTPYLVHWEPGTTHTITPVLQQTSDTQESFVAWSDGATPSRSFTATSGNGWMLAAVDRRFRLQGVATPAVGGSVTFSPPSADGFYSMNSFVTIVPVPAPDYRFIGLGGDVSGGDGILGYAQMDRPRSISAAFAPLQTTISTDPTGLAVTVDGAQITSATTYQWPADSTHEVSAPATIDLDPATRRVYAFDGWSDLRAPTHTISRDRTTFATDLTASFIETVTGIAVPAGAAATLLTPGTADAPRMAALHVSPTLPGDLVPSMLGFVRGHANGDLTMEMAVVPSTPRTWTTAYISDDADGIEGQTRLALYNPGSVGATVGVLLRDASGTPLAAAIGAITVPAGGRVVELLRDVLPLPTTFSALLSVISDQPLVTSIQSVRGNVRSATTLLDPILASPFLPGDQDVPIDQRLQVLVFTPDTTHRLVAFNPGFSSLTGTIAFRDESGAPLVLPLDQGPADHVDYSLPPGGFLVLTCNTPSGTAASPLWTAQVVVTPSAGEPSPTLQLQEEVTMSSDTPAPVVPRNIPASNVATTFRLPVDVDRRETGAIITNVATTAATLTLTLADLTGAVQSQTTVTVPPGGQQTVSSDVLAPPADFKGVLILSSNLPVYGVGYARVQNARGDDILSGLPLLATQPGSIFPFAVDGDSWQTEWWFINPSNAAASADLTFRGEDGIRVFFPIPAGGGQ